MDAASFSLSEDAELVRRYTKSIIQQLLFERSDTNVLDQHSCKRRPLSEICDTPKTPTCGKSQPFSMTSTLANPRARLAAAAQQQPNAHYQMQFELPSCPKLSGQPVCLAAVGRQH
jgi:hypothetical protein